MIPGVTAGPVIQPGDPLGPPGAIAGTIVVTAVQDNLPSFYTARGYDLNDSTFPGGVLVSNTTGHTLNLFAVNIYLSGGNAGKATGGGDVEFIATSAFAATDFTNMEISIGTVTLCVVDAASATLDTEDLGGGVWRTRWTFFEAALSLDAFPVPDDYTLTFT